MQSRPERSSAPEGRTVPLVLSVVTARGLIYRSRRDADVFAKGEVRVTVLVFFDPPGLSNVSGRAFSFHIPMVRPTDSNVLLALGPRLSLAKYKMRNRKTKRTIQNHSGNGDDFLGSSGALGSSLIASPSSRKP